MNPYLQLILCLLALTGYAQAQPTEQTAILERPDLQVIFARNGVEGAFLAYNVTADQYTAYRIGECQRGTLPGSTFKIVNTLIGLETGHLASPETAIAWDGVKRSVPGWNQAHTLQTAFKGSVIPYFQELARRIGLKDMKAWLKQINYGKMEVDRTTLDNFWLTGNSKVSLFEQVDFMRALLAGELPFSAEHRAVLKFLMRTDSPPAYKLYAKSGWVGYGRDEGFPAPEERTDHGWYVGYIERADGKQYVFATRLESQTPVPENWAEARKTVTLECLKKLGVI
jgi:beta-lactamase class D